MKYCQKCGKELVDEAVICVNCGCSTETQPAQPAVVNADAPNIGMAILGFFIPLAGLIIYLVNKDTKPLMAKSAGKGALIGVIVSVVFSIIYGVVLGSILGSAMYY